MTDALTWQPTLLGSGPEPDIDHRFAGLTRMQLDEHSWLDYLPGWVRGQDNLFADLVEAADWAQRSRHMYDKVVAEPRLTSHWHAAEGHPLRPALLEEMRTVLSARYGAAFDSVGMNLYRDGSDSVAWHRDRIPKEIQDPLVVLVSLGAYRRFSVRPHGGGASRSLHLGGGDLLVTGGRFQRDWDHSVPKSARPVGPRISIAFRHGARPAPYRGT
ncbi:MAG TPA: alpha-ketoglutarate-dependent dioxygenase AlkB [Actinomycetota bacterium]|nr:alpha-ketoglutarate-dependent dioxygenase AlkB [Actinomycetota bacterium]